MLCRQLSDGSQYRSRLGCSISIWCSFHGARRNECRKPGSELCLPCAQLGKLLPEVIHLPAWADSARRSPVAVCCQSRWQETGTKCSSCFLRHRISCSIPCLLCSHEGSTSQVHQTLRRTRGSHSQHAAHQLTTTSCQTPRLMRHLLCRMSQVP